MNDANVLGNLKRGGAKVIDKSGGLRDVEGKDSKDGGRAKTGSNLKL